jgi:predicted DNA-binding transcriptional regulator AlpA
VTPKYRLFTPEEVEKWFGVSVAKLQDMRSRPGKDPIPFTKIGRYVRYREDELLKWIERNTFHDTAESITRRRIG